MVRGSFKFKVTTSKSSPKAAVGGYSLYIPSLSRLLSEKSDKNSEDDNVLLNVASLINEYGTPLTSK